MVLDYNNDGQLDFIMADGNHTDYYYVFINSVANVYNLKGTGVSANLTTTLPNTQYAITKARFTVIDQSTLGGATSGLSTTYFLSNDDGAILGVLCILFRNRDHQRHQPTLA